MGTMNQSTHKNFNVFYEHKRGLNRKSTVKCLVKVVRSAGPCLTGLPRPETLISLAHDPFGERSVSTSVISIVVIQVLDCKRSDSALCEWGEYAPFFQSGLVPENNDLLQGVLEPGSRYGLCFMPEKPRAMPERANPMTRGAFKELISRPGITEGVKFIVISWGS